MLRMEKDIGKIRKNDSSEIVVRVDDFGGRKGLTIREDFEKFKEMMNSISDEDMADSGESEGSSEPKPKEKASKKKPADQEELPDY